MSGLRSEIVQDEKVLVALTDDWWQLWHRARSLPFQAPAWLIPWWRTFHPGKLCTFIVRDGERLVAIAPCYLEALEEDGQTAEGGEQALRPTRDFSARCLPMGGASDSSNAEGPKPGAARPARLLPIGIALSDYLDISVDPDYPEAVDCIIEAARSVPHWEVWSLEELPPGATALAMPSVDDWVDSVQPQSASPVLCLPAAVDQLREKVPSEKLRNLRSARRRASRRGEVLLERVEPGRVSDFLRELFRLHDARWSLRGQQGGVFGNQMVRQFQLSAAPDLYRAGLARFYLMSVAGIVVAAYYGLRGCRREYAYLQGFDPEFAHESPGTVVVGHAIEMAVAEGCEEFHFLRGREQYKYSWGAADCWSSRRTLHRPARDGGARSKQRMRAQCPNHA